MLICANIHMGIILNRWSWFNKIKFEQFYRYLQIEIYVYKLRYILNAIKFWISCKSIIIVSGYIISNSKNTRLHAFGGEIGQLPLKIRQSTFWCIAQMIWSRPVSLLTNRWWQLNETFFLIYVSRIIWNSPNVSQCSASLWCATLFIFEF